MRRVIVTSVLSVLVAAVSLPASLSATATTSASPRIARATGHLTGHVTAKQWLAQQRRALTAAGGTVISAPAVAPSGTDNLEELADLVPFGKLKGTSEDVLDVRRVGLPEQGGPLGITARVAATGKALWHRAIHESKGEFVGATPTVVGAHGRRGVLLTTSATTSTAGKDDESLTLAALDGATGKQLWTVTFTGSESLTAYDESTVPSLSGSLTEPGGIPSYLVTSESGVGQDDTSLLYKVAGSSGSYTQLGSPQTEEQDFPVFTSVPGFNHDGVGDVVVVDGGSSPSVSALSGGTGETLWTTAGTGLSDLESVELIGHFSSAKYADLELGGYTLSGTSRYLILDAATGHVIWSRAADQLDAIHTAGKARQAADQLVTFTSTSTPKALTAVATFVAVSAADKVIYVRHVSVSEAPVSGQTSSDAGGGAGIIGDVQGDGSLDDQLDLSVSSTNSAKTRTTTKTGIVDGRTGAFRELNAQTPSDGSLRKGPDTDFMAVTVKGGKPRLSAWRGATRKPYYLSRAIAGIAHVTNAWLTGARVTGHSCSDVLLSAASPSAGVLGVVDGAGHPLWIVRHTAGQATGGTLKRFARPRDYCAA